VPGGALPAELEPVSVESVAFARRYEVGAEPGAANRVRQVFSPTFIDWMVEQAPARVNFEFRAGTLCVWALGALSTVQGLDEFRAAAERMASRLVAEASE
jgi:hypothetical protein